MGEMTKNIHTFVLLSENEPKTYTFAMKQSKIRITDMILLNTKVLLCSMSPLKNKYYIKWTYDSWNRIKDIKYPDGELVSYEYNSAGQLTSMEGLKLGANYAYVNDIEYDKFGSRSSIEYGNGTKTEYTYDAITRRLNNLKSYDASNIIMQDISYTYNNIGNISSQANSAEDINGLGGAYTYSYTYDDISRLTSSSGDFGETADFVLNMSYSASGNISNKTLSATTMLNGISTNIDYNNDYNYNTSQPHTIKTISDDGNTTHNTTWDENGNMTYLNKGTTLTRCMSWDEENRLTAVKDNTTSFSHYIYNAGGERVWKLSGGIERMSINGAEFVDQVNLNKTLYINPYMVASEDNYTKHYYIESQRVTSKIGGGMMINPTIGIHDAIEPINGDTIDIGTNLFTNLTQSSCSSSDMVFNIETSIYSIDEALQIDEQEVIQFFYHSDHLGSSSFITDASGDVDQFIQYMPFGELLVDQRSSGHDIRYKFTGKERDEETGLDYFGARYYQSDLSVWLSVDPLAARYPSTSPFMYVRGNPIMLVDPNGMNDKPNRYQRKYNRKRAKFLKTGKEKHGKALAKYINQNGHKFHRSNAKYNKETNRVDFDYTGYSTEQVGENSGNIDKGYKITGISVVQGIVRGGSEPHNEGGGFMAWFNDLFGINVKGGKGDPSKSRKGNANSTVDLNELMKWDQPNPIEILKSRKVPIIAQKGQLPIINGKALMPGDTMGFVPCKDTNIIGVRLIPGISNYPAIRTGESLIK